MRMTLGELADKLKELQQAENELLEASLAAMNSNDPHGVTFEPYSKVQELRAIYFEVDVGEDDYHYMPVHLRENLK